MDVGLRQGDVISLHVPLNEKTRDLIDTKTLSLMKSSAVLINTARGGVVDHQALAEALRSGKIAGAALDVFPNEPASADDLAMFAGLDNIILTPHVAGLTQEANSRVGTITANNIRRYLEPSS
jgi:(S)-sulfolactate dehydrogenase